MAEKLIVYGTAWCPMVRPVRQKLDKIGVDYEYIDIRDDADGRQRVRDINNGNESVPTLLFADGSTLTEPSGRELESKLAALGHEVVDESLMKRILNSMKGDA